MLSPMQAGGGKRSADLIYIHVTKYANRAWTVGLLRCSAIHSWFVRQLRNFNALRAPYTWHMRERSVKHTWTYVDRSWKDKKLRIYLAKITNKCVRFTLNLRKNCVYVNYVNTHKLRKSQSTKNVWAAENRNHVKTCLPRLSADICAHRRMKSAWNTTCNLPIFHARNFGYSWYVHDMHNS